MMSAIVLAVVCLDIVVFRHDLVLPQLGLAELVSYFVAFGWLLTLIQRRGYDARRRIADIVRANPWVPAYVAWAVIAGVVNQIVWGRADALRACKDMFPGLVLFVSVVHDSKGMAFWRHMLIAVVSVVTVSSVLAISQYLIGAPYLNTVNPDAWFKHGFDGYSLVMYPAVGVLAHPNGLALQLIPLLTLLAGALGAFDSQERGALPIGVLVCAAAIGTVGMLASQAKIALMIGLVSTVVAFGGSVRAARFSGRMAGLLAVCIITAFATLVVIAQVALSRAGGLETGTLAYRLYLMMESLQLLGSNPGVFVLGGGTDLFRASHPLQLSVHNELVNQALRYGVPGALLFGAMIRRAFIAPRGMKWEVGVAMTALMTALLAESANGVQAFGLVLGMVGLCTVERGVDQAQREGAGLLVGANGERPQ